MSKDETITVIKVRDSLWNKYAASLKQQDLIRNKVVRLQNELHKAEREARKQKEHIEVIQDVMRCLAAGMDIHDIMDSFNIGKDFLPK